MKILKLLLIVFIGFLGLGTLSACSQQKKNGQKEVVTLTTEEKKKLRKEEEKIALYLVNHYEDVKKIKFDKFHRGGFGIADSISVIVNDDSYIKPIIFNDDSERYSVDYDPSDFHLIKKKNSTELTSLDGIEVIYYEEK